MANRWHRAGPHEPPKIVSLELQEFSLEFSEGGLIFENVNATLPAHQVVWVRTDNSQGKSVLLKVLSGLVAGTSGSYRINGHAIEEMSAAEFMPFRLRIGYSFDYGGLLSNRTLAENLLLPLLYHRIEPYDAALARVETWAERFKFSPFLGQRPSDVPGAVRKACVLARACLLEPDLLLLDEPTAGLRTPARQGLFDWLREFRAKKPEAHIFLTSEDRQLVATFATAEMAIVDRDVQIISGVESMTGRAG